MKYQRLALLLCLFCLAVSACLNGSDDHSELIYAMISQENCQPPCFFGQSLSGLSQEEILRILETSNIMQDVQIDTEYDRYISWSWSEDMVNLLTDKDLKLTQDENHNFVLFEDNRLFAIELSFAIYLEDLLDIVGEPVEMFAGPYSSAKAGLVFVYDSSPVGHFHSWFSCSDPSISADMVVHSYYYDTRFTSDIYSTEETIVEWQGLDGPVPIYVFAGP